MRKNCFSDREKLLNFEAEGREFAKILRSLKSIRFSKTVFARSLFDIKKWYLYQTFQLMSAVVRLKGLMKVLLFCVKQNRANTVSKMDFWAWAGNLGR